MRDQRNLVAEDEARIDRAVLELPLGSDRLWSVEEASREIDDSLGTADAVARLHGAGLVHRLDGFVFATRAAVHARRLA